MPEESKLKKLVDGVIRDNTPKEEVKEEPEQQPTMQDLEEKYYEEHATKFEDIDYNEEDVIYYD
jgi:molybdopterin converting factor small subunit